MDLFEQHRQTVTEAEAPLAARMRPRSLDEFVGQDAIIGPGRLLRRVIQADQLSSLIFYADHLRKRLSDQEIATIRDRATHSLSNQTVIWESAIAYISGTWTNPKNHPD